VLWFRLDANAIWPLHVATHNCPHHTTGEDESGKVTDERVGLVHATVQELE